MARSTGERATVGLPISALLAPQTGSPPTLLPSPSVAVLGPLPPTTPLHLALNWIALSDLPEYTEEGSAGQDHNGQGMVRVSSADGGGPERPTRTTRRQEGRVLVITGSKDEYHRNLEEDDEDWMRLHGAEYGVLASLKRVDMRYCPTSRHLLLLLNLLTAQRDSGDVYTVERPPALIVLWDVASLLMEDTAADENAPLQPARPPEAMEIMDETSARAAADMGEKSFKPGTTIANYLDLVSAARAAVDHLRTSPEKGHQTQLIVLEPHLNLTSSLPIIAPPLDPSTASASTIGTPTKPPPSTPTRSKRIQISEGLKWLLGQDALVSIQPAPPDEHADEPDAKYTVQVTAESDETYSIRRRRCGRGDWASAATAEAEVEGDKGGWRWEWC